MPASTDDELRDFVAARYVHLRRTAYQLCGQWHRAEDLVQTALARVVVAARRRRETPEATPAGCTPRCRGGARAWRRERSFAEIADRPGAEAEPEVAVAVLAALKALPPRQRAAAVLRYWVDRDVEQTALLLGVTASTAKVQPCKCAPQVPAVSCCVLLRSRKVIAVRLPRCLWGQRRVLALISSATT